MQFPLDDSSAQDLIASSLFLGHVPCAKDGSTAAHLGKSDECVLVMGAFDGLHLGHRALVARALADARARGLSCLAVTFSPDPSDVLGQGQVQSRLLAVEDRVVGLRALGVDGVLVLPFTRELAALSPEHFVRQELLGRLCPRIIHVGSNFRFGYQASGTVDTLRTLGASLGFEVCESPLVEACGKRVSSTRIRGLLAQEGRLEDANALLGRCHFLRGNVEHGRGEGTSFGFPTANVRFGAGSCMPAEGVYAGFVTLGASAWPAAINVGAPPSFSGPDPLFCEANLIGFSGNAYGADVSVTFVRWLRASRPFDSLDELERVVLGNIDWVRCNLGAGEVRLVL